MAMTSMRQPVNGAGVSRNSSHPHFWRAVCCGLLLAHAVTGMASDLSGPRNDPAFREQAAPAYFPNRAIAPKYPEAKPQTHGLDLGKHDW